VAHLSEGVLRRLYDEPLALDESARTHYHGCPTCQHRFRAVASDARQAMALMATPGATVDASAALTRLKARLEEDRGRRWWSLPVPTSRSAWGWRKPALAVAIAAGLTGSLAFTPLAQSLVEIFQPTQVTPVTVSRGDLKGLDALSGWGTVTWTTRPELQQADSRAEAARISGLPQIQVDQGKLPAGLAKAPVSYAATGQAVGRVSFNDHAPAKLRGSTLTTQVGPAEAVLFGDVAKARAAVRHGSGDERGANAETTRRALSQAGPILGVVEMRAPKVSSTGASVQDIKRALLAQPNLSPAARAEIQALDNPTGNLPIPIDADRQTAKSVTVQGVKGTEIGDNTGLGAGVIWIKGGVVHAVAGTVTQDQALQIANSL
jgi:hypothetical protein